MCLTSKTGVLASHTSRLHAHHVQPRLRQQSNATAWFQPRLPWSCRHDRSHFACFMADAPDCNVETDQQVRYKGVSSRVRKSYASRITIQGRQRHLGVYSTPDEAARVYDEACIFQKRDPVNFPKSQYDEATILQVSDVDTFVKQKKAAGRLNAKALNAKSSMFIGVTRSPTGKWVSRGPVEGRLESTVVKLGVFPTEELAAQAYDKLQIYKGLDTMHFPKGSYDLQPILMHKTIDDLVASIKKEARALNKTSRYTGVHKMARSKTQTIFAARTRSTNGHRVHLGSYETEEQAAMSHDQSCIYQGHSPVNFPDHPYDTQDICKPADFAEFVLHSREMAARPVKSQQTSRFTGVSWNQACNKWEAYVHETSPSKRKTNLGLFVDEHQAAQAVDERREALGKEAVNFPLKSSQTNPDIVSTWLRTAT